MTGKKLRSAEVVQRAVSSINTPATVVDEIDLGAVELGPADARRLAHDLRESMKSFRRLQRRLDEWLSRDVGRTEVYSLRPPSPRRRHLVDLLRQSANNAPTNSGSGRDHSDSRLHEWEDPAGADWPEVVPHARVPAAGTGS